MRTKRVKHSFAVGAAPTGEPMAVNPDQFAHRGNYKIVRFGINLRALTSEVEHSVVDD